MLSLTRASLMRVFIDLFHLTMAVKNLLYAARSRQLELFINDFALFATTIEYHVAVPKLVNKFNKVFLLTI